jgi:hypothetical protein
MNGGKVDWERATKAQDAIVVALAETSLSGPMSQSPPALAWHHRSSTGNPIDAPGRLLETQR